MKQKDRINNRILEYIDRNDLLPEGSRVCVGFSGGADSLFLLYFLWKNQEKLKISLAACHVNHQMRGVESDGDQEFARAFCREKRIPFYAFSYPVEELAAAWHMGCEEAGRKVRREAFGICLEKYGMTCIALAHHRNDQAETMLFHLARGSSLRGMAGIRPSTVFQYSAERVESLAGQSGHENVGDENVSADNLTFGFGSSGSDSGDDSEKSKGMQEGRMIHPLLCLERDEIEACLREADLSWRTDHTNLETAFSRNKIRHRVMSYLQEEINRQAVSHLAQAAEQAGRADDFLRSEAAARAGKYVTGATGEFLEAGDSYTSERYKDIGKNTHSEKNSLGDSGEKIGTEKDSSADKSTKKDSSADKSTKKDMSVDKSTEKVSSVDKSGKLFYGKSQYIDISDRILEEPEIMQDYILMDLLSRMAGSRKDIDSGHVKRLQALFSMEAGREISLPYGLRAVRRYGEIRLGLNSRTNRREKNDKVPGKVNSRQKNTGQGAANQAKADQAMADLRKTDHTALSRQDWTQPITGQGIFACGPFQLDVALEESALLDQIPQKKYTKWLDYDNIKNGLVVRKRRPGDYFLLDGEGHRKKLKEFFVEQKIPREERDDIYLLASGSRVFWIIGYRISNDAKVTDQTQHVVRLNFGRNEK